MGSIGNINEKDENALVNKDALKIYENDIVDHNLHINGHNFTIGWILNSLRKNDQMFIQKHGNRKVSDVTFYDMSGGKGFLSIVYRITIIFDDFKNDNDDVYTTILKIPGAEHLVNLYEKINVCEVKDDFIFKIAKFHKRECEFYTQIAPHLDVPIPKVFETKLWNVGIEEGCIHMEDLTNHGKTLNFFTSANISQVKNVIQHLAHMHKQALIMDNKFSSISWKGKYFGGETLFLEINELLEQCIERFLMSCNYKEPFASLLTKYKKFILNKDFIIWAFNESHKELGMPPVIVHGDLWGGNILWEINSDGNIKNSVAEFVDWQIMHEGSPITDIARFLSLNTDGLIRREIEKYLVDFYFDLLKKELDEDDFDIPYTKKQLQQNYNIRFILEAFQNIHLFVFTTAGLKNDDETKNTLIENAILKTLHALEDMDKLLQGDLKYVFERFGK